MLVLLLSAAAFKMDVKIDFIQQPCIIVFVIGFVIVVVVAVVVFVCLLLLLSLLLLLLFIVVVVVKPGNHMKSKSNKIFLSTKSKARKAIACRSNHIAVILPPASGLTFPLLDIGLKI